MRSTISNSRGEYSVDSSLHAKRPDIGLWRFHKRIDSADREVGPDHTALRVQPPLECRECKPERRRICGAQSEDGRSRRSCEKAWLYQSRRAPAELFLHICRSQPVLVNAGSAANCPISLARRIPGEAHTRTPQIVDCMKKRIWSGLCISVANLLRPCCACSEIEVAEDGWGALRPRISTIVITQAQSHGQTLASLPGVFRERPKGFGCRVPIPQSLFSSCGIVHDSAFV